MHDALYVLLQDVLVMNYCDIEKYKFPRQSYAGEIENIVTEDKERKYKMRQTGLKHWTI